MPARSSVFLCLLAGGVVAGSISAAHAGGFALREQSAYGQGASFAGVAAGGSPSSAFWNPSIITRYSGVTFEKNLSVVSPTSEIESLSATRFGTPVPAGALNDSGDIGLTGLVPSGTGIYRINDRLSVGIVTSAPFGLATDANENFSGDIFGSTAKVFTANVAPTIAYRFNDWLSLGANVQVQYIDARLNSEVTDLSGDDVGFGFGLGASFTPVEGTEIGIGFRSATTHTLKGSATQNLPLALTGGVPVFSGDVEADVTLPEMISVGLRQRLGERFTLLGTFEWSNWSRLGTIAINYKDTGRVLVEEFNWNDGYFAAIGGEYAFNEATTVRAGIGYEWSPVDDSNRAVRIPDSNRLWLSAGVSHSFSDRLQAHAGYSFLMAEEGDISLSSAGIASSFTGESSGHVHIFSVGLKGQF